MGDPVWNEKPARESATFKEAAATYAAYVDNAYDEGSEGKPGALLQAETLLALAPDLDEASGVGEIGGEVDVRAYQSRLEAWVKLTSSIIQL